MKARPRAVENRVANALSALFVQIGALPVERIPVLGRTGPDITLNELKLVVDVKSRLECPKSYFCSRIAEDELHFIIPLRLIPQFLKQETEPFRLSFTSTLVRRYWEHMDAWTRANEPDGISAIMMHRPKMPVGRAVLILSKNDTRRLISRWKPQS